MTGSSAGAPAASCNASGRNWSRSATSWGPWTGNGRPLTAGWARPGSGGKKVGKNPTDRGKKGTKQSVLVEGDGGPLAAVIAAANVNDQKLLWATDLALSHSNRACGGGETRRGRRPTGSGRGSSRPSCRSGRGSPGTCTAMPASAPPPSVGASRLSVSR